MTTMIEKCVIAAAGRGTRVSSLSRGRSKEMLEAGGKPLIGWALDEALASGFRRLCLVSSPAKPEMEEWVTAIMAGKPAGSAELHIVRQDRPSGSAAAVELARDFVDGDPFALLFPDNIVRAVPPVPARLAAVFARRRTSINALMEVREAEEAAALSASGRAELEKLGAALFRVVRIEAKRRGETYPFPPLAPRLRLFPRAVLAPEFFEYLDRVRPPPGEDFDDSEVFALMAREGRLEALRVAARVFDAGNPAGLRRARAHCRKERRIE